MKRHSDLILLAVFLLSLPVCIWAWFWNIALLLYITAIPFFCLQLLLCRVSSRPAARLAPCLPVLLALAAALYYLVRDSGWDRLAALIFALAAIAPAVGIALGWLVWRLSRK